MLQAKKYYFSFAYIIKKHETLADNPSKRLYILKIGNIITSKIKTGLETMKQWNRLEELHIRWLKSKMVKMCLIYSYQHDSGVLYTFVPDKSFS